MQPVYNIQHTESETLQSRLLIELGLNGARFLVWNPEHKMTALVSYAFPADTSNAAIAEALQPLFNSENLLQQSFKRVDIIHSLKESVWVPAEYINAVPSKEMLELIYGNTASSIVKSDFVPEHNIFNIYSLPAELISLLDVKFPGAFHTHRYSLLSALVKESGSQLYCIFEENRFSILLLEDQQPQLVQTFSYSSSYDAAYYLLNISRHHNLDHSTLTLRLSGPLSKESEIAAEIGKHFTNIIWEHLPNEFSYHAAIGAIPSHYFSYLFSFAACVL